MQAQVFTAYEGYLRASEKETIHKRYTAAESEKERNTVEPCVACPCTQRASANIGTFPSAIVLPKQKPWRSQLGKNSSLTSPSLPPSLSHNQWSTHWLMEWALQLRLKRGIWIASPPPGSSELLSLLKRFVAMLSRLCHFHSSAAALLFHLSSALWAPCGRPADSSWTWGESQQQRRGRSALI